MSSKIHKNVTFRSFFLFFGQIILSFPLTKPADKVLEGDQVVLVLVQQGEGTVGQRVVVLVRAGWPRSQQPVQAFELGPVQPILPLHKSASGVAVLPRGGFRRCCRAAVAPV